MHRNLAKRKQSVRVVNIGPDLNARRLLDELVRNEAGVAIEYLETGTMALEVLLGLSEDELPAAIVIPFRLPLMTAIDFIAKLHLRERLLSIPILIWGPRIFPDEIDIAYKAGAAAVLMGEFGTTHLEALRRLCGNASGDPNILAIRDSRPIREIKQRNARLGELFVSSGCLSASFWTVESLLKSHQAAFAPLSVYAALMAGGATLMVQNRRKFPAVPRD